MYKTIRYERFVDENRPQDRPLTKEDFERVGAPVIQVNPAKDWWWYKNRQDVTVGWETEMEEMLVYFGKDACVAYSHFGNITPTHVNYVPEILHTVWKRKPSSTPDIDEVHRTFLSALGIETVLVELPEPYIEFRCWTGLRSEVVAAAREHLREHLQIHLKGGIAQDIVPDLEAFVRVVMA